MSSLVGMEKIRIPSPSAILDPIPAASPAGRSTASVSTRNAASAQTATTVTTNKPKQSKSRNGTVLSILYSHPALEITLKEMDRKKKGTMIH